MRRRYDRQGILALNPQAFFDFFPEPPERTNAAAGDVAIVDIRGPLEHHAGSWCDSYDEILERVDAACTTSARAIVLRIDSPGGDAGGCLEAARAIREKCAAAGKPLFAYVDGQACSAAYALACAAKEIVTSETGIVGSIGVLNVRCDATESNKQWGLRFALITSGARKADGHPYTQISEAELAATQGIIDSLAGTFFGLVEDLRGLPAAKVEALEAGIFHGDAAIEAGLADSVEPFSALLARLAGAEPEGDNMATKYEEARAALEEAAKGDGEEAEKAKKAIKAMDGEEEPAESEEDEPAAESEDEPPADDDKPKEEEASRSARRRATVPAATAGAIAAEANTLAARIVKLERNQEASDRKTFLAARPDLAPELVKVLATKPLAEVKSIVNAIPKPKGAKLGERAAATTPAATRGDGQVDGTAPRLPPEQKRALDLRMGLVSEKTGITSTPHKLTLGSAVPSTQADSSAAPKAGNAGKVA